MGVRRQLLYSQSSDGKESDCTKEERLRSCIVKVMDYQFTRVIHLTDSRIVRDQIRNESYGFKTYTAVRVAEIQQNTEPHEWHWVPSAENPADLGTKGIKLAEEEQERFWKHGPDFLGKPNGMLARGD